MPVRIIVCGGRDYQDRRHVFRVLDHIHTQRGIAEVIHGDCETGADSFAKEWATERNIAETPCPAEWENFDLPGALVRVDGRGRKYVANAGPLRNAYMLTLKPEGVVGFPGGKGTRDMCAQARASGVPVYLPPNGQ